MATRTRQYTPNDAANIFVRVLLSDAGKLAGGLSKEQENQTLEFFENCCAYTGEPLNINEDNKAWDWDHAIPINQDYCGLHLYGNVVPATKNANGDKRDLHYRDFVSDAVRLQKIECFMAQAGYHERAQPFRGLQAYCRTQYEVIKGLCKANTDLFGNALAEGESRA